MQIYAENGWTDVYRIRTEKSFTNDGRKENCNSTAVIFTEERIFMFTERRTNIQDIYSGRGGLIYSMASPKRTSMYCTTLNE